MAAVIGLLVVMEAAANPILAAGFGFDLAAAAHFGSLFDRGAEAAELIRWGALIDLGGYLSFGVVILYLGLRLWRGNELVVATLTASGVGAVLVGGTGAAVLAVVVPSLLGDFAGAPGAAGEAARVALETLGRAIAGGAWGIVTFGLLGAWLVGIGLLLGRDRVGALAIVGGIGMLASSIRTGLTGRILPDLAGPFDTVIVLAIVGLLSFAFVWLLWLALRLWRGPDQVIEKPQVSRG